jgi:hypothetical protein
LLALWGLALLAYGNSFRSGLVFDNRYVIAQDTRIRQATFRNAQLILTQDYWYGTADSALYRPVTTFSYLFNYTILGNGVAPAGYHWVNFALHAGNIALVYLLGWLLLGEFWPAFAMAALWAVHPVLTESVTNIVGRADLLAALGVLAGLLCYARSVPAGGRRAIRWLMALAAASAVGVFSKESGVVVLAAVFLYDVAFCRSVPLRSRLPGYLATALPVAAYLLARSLVLSSHPVAVVAFADNPLAGAGFWPARLTAVKVLGKYLWLLVWPGRLSCDYSYNQIPLVTGRFHNWEDWKAILALAACAAAAAVAVVSYRRSKPVFFFVAFFFATLAPTANLAILIGTIMAERFLYLPSIGFAGCLVWAGWAGYARLGARRPAVRWMAQVALAALCLGFCARTFARNADWFDEQSLWSSAARSCPASYKTHLNLASVLATPPVSAVDAGRNEIERTLAILRPLPDEQNVPAAYATAGLCYRVKGDSLGPVAGAPWYRKALDVLAEGQRLARSQPVGAAILYPLYLELGRTYRNMGEFQKALEALDRGRRIDPRTEFFEAMSLTYRAMGDSGQAAISLLEGITMDAGGQLRLAAEVVDLYRQTAPGSCALTGSGNAAALNFECPLVRSQLCAAGKNVAELYRRMGRGREAAETAASAVKTLGCPVEMFR